jgi:hypothetical protein
MTDTAPPRGPGRPRQYPAGTTATDRKAVARRNLKKAGGHSIEVELGAAAWAALQKMAPRGERGPFIERLILAERRRKVSDSD